MAATAPGTATITAATTTRSAPGGEDHRCPERNIRADALDEYVFAHVRAALTEPALLLAGEQAVALAQPIPDDELPAAELTRLDRKIANAGAGAEQGRLVDLFQAGLIEMPELQRRSCEVAARHDELATKRSALAAERTALTPGNLLRRRVNDFTQQIRGVIDQLDRPQRQHLMRLLIEDVRVTGSHVQIQLRIPLDPPTPGSTGPRRPGPKPTGQSVSSQDRLRSLGDHRGRLLPDARSPHQRRHPPKQNLNQPEGWGLLVGHQRGLRLGR